MTEQRIIIAGSGGQGILFLGKMLATAGMVEGRKVTWFPSYGAEMRGGTANCTVIISDDMIGSPVVQSPDILVVMNKASLDRFEPHLKKKGLLFYDSSLIRNAFIRPDIRGIAVPATDIASAAGTTKAANMVLLGALVSQTGIVRAASIETQLAEPSETSRKKAFAANRKAFEKGLHHNENQKSADRRRKDNS